MQNVITLFMRRIAKMPLWAESRIHGDVYVRFGGRLSETYHRKVAWRRQPSLQITKEKLNQDMEILAARLNGIEEFAGCTI